MKKRLFIICVILSALFLCGSGQDEKLINGMIPGRAELTDAFKATLYKVLSGIDLELYEIVVISAVDKMEWKPKYPRAKWDSLDVDLARRRGEKIVAYLESLGIKATLRNVEIKTDIRGAKILIVPRSTPSSLLMLPDTLGRGDRLSISLCYSDQKTEKIYPGNPLINFFIVDGMACSLDHMWTINAVDSTVAVNTQVVGCYSYLHTQRTMSADGGITTQDMRKIFSDTVCVAIKAIQPEDEQQEDKPEDKPEKQIREDRITFLVAVIANDKYGLTGQVCRSWWLFGISLDVKKHQVGLDSHAGLKIPVLKFFHPYLLAGPRAEIAMDHMSIGGFVGLQLMVKVYGGLSLGGQIGGQYVLTYWPEEYKGAGIYNHPDLVSTIIHSQKYQPEHEDSYIGLFVRTSIGIKF